MKIQTGTDYMPLGFYYEKLDSIIYFPLCRMLFYIS